MTLLKAVNVLIFQWFFIRLTRCQNKVVENYSLHSFSLMPDGNVGSRGTGDVKTYQWYSFQFWIVPCTGWWNKFKHINGNIKFIKCTKTKLKK